MPLSAKNKARKSSLGGLAARIYKGKLRKLTWELVREMQKKEQTKKKMRKSEAERRG